MGTTPIHAIHFDDPGDPFSPHGTSEAEALSVEAALQALSGTYLALNAATQAKLDTAESTTSTTFVDLATVGPTITKDVGASGRVLVLFEAWGRNSVDGAGALVSISLTGANTVVPSDARAGIMTSAAAGAYGSMPWFEIITGLTAGATTFTLRYRATANTATFANRRLIVIPL